MIRHALAWPGWVEYDRDRKTIMAVNAVVHYGLCELSKCGKFYRIKLPDKARKALKNAGYQ